MPIIRQTPQNGYYGKCGVFQNGPYAALTAASAQERNHKVYGGGWFIRRGKVSKQDDCA